MTEEDTKSTSVSPVKEVATGDQSLNTSKKKKSRHRNRKLYSDILKQMEFYFSDANLHKDKFLQEHMSHDGWIEVDLLADFNKIKTITTDKRVLVRAISKSSVLEVHSDGKRVRRKSPFQPPNAEEVGRRTVYLEPLPLEADHSFVTNILKPCGGRILYVSLPRFKRSKQLKGFAFVEFDSTEAAEKACEMFSPSRLAVSDPVATIMGRFPQSNKQMESLKRRTTGEGCTSTSAPAPGEPTDPPPHSGKTRSRNRTNSTSNGGVEDSASTHNNNNNAQSFHLNQPNDSSNKYWVISKQRWSELKSQYLTMQKERISALKQIVAGKNPCPSPQSAEASTAQQKAEGDAKRKHLKRKNVSDHAELASLTAPAEAVKPKHIKFTDEGEDCEEAFTGDSNNKQPLTN